MGFLFGVFTGSLVTVLLLYFIGKRMRRSGSQSQKIGVHETVVTRTETFGRDGPVDDHENQSRDEDSGEAY